MGDDGGSILDVFTGILEDIKTAIILLVVGVVGVIVLVYFFAYLPTANLPVQQQSSVTSIESTAVSAAADPAHTVLIIAAILISAILAVWAAFQVVRKR